MYRCIALTFEAILHYDSVYCSTAQADEASEVENWKWDNETTTKAQGLLAKMQTPQLVL